MRYLTLILAVVLSLGANWPQFRGPNGSGVPADEKGYPVEWSNEKNIAWSAELPGIGIASPVVYGDRVYVTACSGYDQDRLHVLAFDAKSGTKLWHRQLWATGSTKCNNATNMAAPTPVADEDGVYALFATGDLIAFRHDGQTQWYRSLVGDYPLITNQVGMASSLVVRDGRLILPMDNAGDSFVAAVDTRYGENVWKVKRPNQLNWVTPVFRQAGDRTELLFQTPDRLIAYDLDNGQQLWTYGDGMSTMPSTVVAQDRIFATQNGVVALDPSGKGQPKKLWDSTRLASRYGSPLFYRGSLYSVNRSGVLMCVNPENGDLRWNERIGGTISASLVAADGKVYLIDEAGKGYVVRVDEDGAEVVATNELDDKVLATPALADGRLYIRAESKLYCIGTGSK